MSTLSVTRSLISYTNPTETQFDTMRTDLLTYFNSANMTEANLAAGGVTFSKLTTAPDDDPLVWTSSHGAIEYVTGSTTLRIKNTQGAMVFKTSGTEMLRVASSGTTTMGSGGRLSVGMGVGHQGVDTMWLLAKYTKPRLQYTSADVVTALDNGAISGTVLLMLPGRLTKIYDTTMSLAATANGYDSGHTSTAVSGIRSGESRTANTWYYIYGALIRGGDQADGTQSVLVASTTSPVQANVSTINGYFGAGNWVYMGLVRNGYNDGTNTNIIVHFIKDGNGTTRFTSSYESGLTNGIRLATATGSSSDLTYTLSFGTGATDIPPVCTRAIFGGYRSAYGFDLEYVDTISGEANMRCSLGDNMGASYVGLVNMDVPLITNYQVKVNLIGTNSTNQRISLAAVTDHYE